MRKILLTVFCLCSVGLAYGQSKIDLQSQLELFKLRNTSIPTYNSRTRSFERPKSVPENTMAMVELKDQDGRADLEAQGVRVLRVRGNIAIVVAPIKDIERIADLKCVRRMELPRRVYQKMDVVRKEIGVDKIHQGLDLPQAYTGKGVVTGIVDGGIDPNHINFLKPDGSTRFGYISKITASQSNKDGYQFDNYYPRAVLDTMTNRDNAYAIEDFTTDSYTTFHGTHTTGIMAGGYKGDITYAKTNDNDRSYKVVGPNPFYGCATESELVASCGDLRDQYIAFGVDDVVQYSLLSGKKPKPCVINLSLGSNIGVHDSTSVMNRFLAEEGKHAIICVAAGNEANMGIALKKDFKDAGETVKTFLTPMQPDTLRSGNKTYFNLRNGQIAAYSNDSTEFELQIVVTNANRRNRAVARIPILKNTNSQPVTYASGGNDYSMSGAVIDPNFAKAFDGYVTAASAIDAETGRYYAMAQIMTSDNQKENQDGHYKLALEIKSKKPGQRVEVYSDAQFIYFDSNRQEGFVSGTRNGSISDMACAANIVTVGSYNVRNHWSSLDGFVYGYNKRGDEDDFPEGEASRFSSFGTLADGRNLPHVCAPGASIISSVNTYAVENPDLGYGDMALQGRLEKGGKKYYWHQSLGTSMATPVVAGAIALWLEANPSLTVKDVVRIIQQTARKDNFVTNTGDPVQWGAGKFDAYAGLKQVLKEKETNGINGVKYAESQEVPVITMTGERSFSAFLAGAKQLNLRAYSLSGQLVHSLSAQGDELNVNASSWNKGVYLIQVNGGKAQRIVIY
ncbi:S8 family peptidase [Prevotella melaninogenica]|uniref:S8 family serine peptidase n=1 Tax=Prevotella melaninogenica TaxID=28132 RepID=UPI001BA9FBAE|nr:S8 family serine peptidase [Prevotella melaninogenica]QUB69809.1 S8 family peptidase [Prevotella melaninogenica]